MSNFLRLPGGSKYHGSNENDIILISSEIIDSGESSNENQIITP